LFCPMLGPQAFSCWVGPIVSSPVSSTFPPIRKVVLADQQSFVIEGSKSTRTIKNKSRDFFLWNGVFWFSVLSSLVRFLFFLFHFSFFIFLLIFQLCLFFYDLLVFFCVSSFYFLFFCIFFFLLFILRDFMFYF
jgi:hypothetical protein